MSNWECCPQTRTYLTKSSTFILVYPGGVHNFFLSEPSFLAAASKTSFYCCQINPAGEVSSEHFNPTMKKSSKSLGFRWIVPILPPRFCWSKFPDSSLINQLKSSITYKPQFFFPAWISTATVLAGCAKRVARRFWRCARVTPRAAAAAVAAPSRAWVKPWLPAACRICDQRDGIGVLDMIGVILPHKVVAELDRKPIGEVSSCDAWQNESTDGPKGGWGSLSLSLPLSPSLPIFLSFFLSSDLSIYLSISLPICLSIYLPSTCTYLCIYL